MSRTTVTLTDQAEAVVRTLMADRNISFKAALNLAIIEPVSHAEPVPFETPVREIGFRVPLDHATTLVGELEDIELMRRRALGK
ncbi:MAG: hypothetical protein ACSLFF_07515 [Solirubrobacterales bacterium]